jgi:hypothetical protein
MKTKTIYRTTYANQPHIPYPNAATRREIFDKVLDLLLMAAMGVGAAAIILFMLVLT